jgi:hypothetical protein
MLLLLTCVTVAHGAVTTTGSESIRVEAVNPPISGLVDIRARRVSNGIEVDSTWIQTGSARMHYCNSARLELRDTHGNLISSETLTFHPKIRSYGRRDRVWVMHRYLAAEPAAAVGVKLVFLGREET